MRRFTAAGWVFFARQQPVGKGEWRPMAVVGEERRVVLRIKKKELAKIR
jgi:hypothetical protein